MSKLPTITVISFNKPKSHWANLLDQYQKRLERSTTFRHIVLREKGDTPELTRVNATKELVSKIPKNAYTILCDERGKQISSPLLARELELRADQHVVFIIGSSYGVDIGELPVDRALSFSDMVLPHELARLLLFEQLYRAHTILVGHPYHHS